MISEGSLPPEMAETIALHLAAGAGAAPLQGAGALPLHHAQQHVLIYEDEEYPFPSGTINGAKACTKCGATKTPQWREGPLGSKTLCNACGVKRTRKLRAEQEGAKRRKLSASPAPPRHYAKYPARAAAAAAYNDLPAALADSYQAGPELEAWGLLAPQQAPGGSRRPPRRAAEEAAYRTARYARTGEWDEGGDEEALRAPTPTSSSDASLPSSSCPEEVSWPPLAGDGAGGPDCYAAVNLMTMSAKHRQAGTGPFGAAPSSPGGASSPALSARGCAPGLGQHGLGQHGLGSGAAPAGPAELEQFNHDGLLALAARYDGGAAPRPHKVAPVDLADLSACLPPAKVLELVRLNQELECAVHEAHAANAAVAAVAQVLATKQAAALRSREAAGAATKRLRRLMSELDTQFGIQAKLALPAAGRSAPLSPAKPAGLPSLAPLSPPAPLLAPLLPAAPALDGYPAL